MTKDEIIAKWDGMTPRERDAWIAEKVMGWEIRRIYNNDDSFHEYYYRNGVRYENVNYPDEWQPSKFIEIAWEVVEKVRKLFGKRIQITEMAVGWKRWSAGYGDSRKHEYSSDSAPEAICLAALLAVMTE